MPDPTTHPDTRFPTLESVRDWAWQALRDGVARSKHNYHTGVLTTVTPDGGPAARVVVLRGVDAGDRTLLCHTDARAHKVEQLRASPRVAWVFWDPRARVQLRVAGDATLHHDDELADRQWDRATATSRRCYLAPRPPSSPADGPSPNLPDNVLGEAPSVERVAAGRSNFAVLRTAVRSIDWLYLHHAGHRRALWLWDPQGDATATWLEP